MFKWFYAIFIAAILAISSHAFAKNNPVNAININIGSDGRGVDGNAIGKVRRLSGDALASGVVDVFIVKAPKKGGPIFIEGGLSACAEAGFSSTSKSFNKFIGNLRAIHPKTGTFINVSATPSCTKTTPPPVMCGGIAGLACPTNQVCVDDPNDTCNPNNGGADCSGICKTK
ncbi:hypothetical protein [Crenothrix polyspora]|uniref:Kazal-type serine protease inhibitor domain n=1 Tax=Crenothrix polyspora TaxID=360316 RepID=A0A1R4H926_9GAMM